MSLEFKFLSKVYGRKKVYRIGPQDREKSQKLTFHILPFPDGWAMEDVRYVWKVPDPVQFAPNLFLPGAKSAQALLLRQRRSG